MMQTPMRILSPAFIIALLALSSCKTKTDSTSSEKWGGLVPSSAYLINLPSGSTINVCGSYFDKVQWAIQTWASAIGRSYRVVSDCSNPTINVFGLQDTYAVSECEKLNLKGRAFAQSFYAPQEIVDCGVASHSNVMLHEVGHLFGLCDQYSERVGNCSENHGVVVGSVMNASNSMSLTADDIAGIRALAQAYPSGGGLVPQSHAGSAGSRCQMASNPTTDQLIQYFDCINSETSTISEQPKTQPTAQPAVLPNDPCPIPPNPTADDLIASLKCISAKTK